MAYRPDTYIVEESAGLYLAHHLKLAGYRVLVHDVQAKPENSPSLIEFENLENVEALMRQSNVAVAAFCCPWPQYRNWQLPKGIKLIDPWGVRRDKPV